MQSATEFDQNKVKEAVKAQVQAEAPVTGKTIDIPIEEIAPEASTAPVATPAPAVTPAKPAKPRLRQQAYYLTEDEIKTIKRLSYELDIPKSDLVRKFIDEGISKIDQK